MNSSAIESHHGSTTFVDVDGCWWMLNECVDYITVRPLPIFWRGPTGPGPKSGLGDCAVVPPMPNLASKASNPPSLLVIIAKHSFVYINFFLVTFSPLLVELSSYNPNPIIIYLFNP